MHSGQSLRQTRQLSSGFGNLASVSVSGDLARAAGDGNWQGSVERPDHRAFFHSLLNSP